jgi:radical SAM protein (TIGR01212 family)
LHLQHHSKPYNSYTDFLKSTFSGRVQKLSVHADMNCPNRDGTKGIGGCTYCNNHAFTPSYCHTHRSITQQVAEGIEFHKRRYRRANKFIVYFQSYSNTYDTIDVLEKKFLEALSIEHVIGISIGTRPDCISIDTVELLAEIAKKYYVSVELGIESVYDKTLVRINRGHTMNDTIATLEQLSKYNITTGGHFIIGLPGESDEEMLNATSIISNLTLKSIKLHQLQILKDTTMANEYMANPRQFELFELADYINFIVRFVERLSPQLFIDRFAAEVPPRFLIAPDWGMIRYEQILKMIIQKFYECNTFQGRLYKI